MTTPAPSDINESGPSSTLPGQTVPSDQQSGSERWSLPKQLTPREVWPDRCTTPAMLNKQLGKATDPGRWAIYLCLLDEHPHLHPSLPALHKHRFAIHGIPIPANPTDLPVPARLRKTQDSLQSPERKDRGEPARSEIPEINITVTQSALTADEAFSPNIPIDHDSSTTVSVGDDAMKEVKDTAIDSPEWLTWKFTEEEEIKRKAYLPLA